MNCPNCADIGDRWLATLEASNRKWADELRKAKRLRSANEAVGATIRAKAATVRWKIVKCDWIDEVIRRADAAYGGVDA